MGLTVAEAKAKRVCRICGEPIAPSGQPIDWPERFGKMVWPIAVTLDFGAEFAHTDCLPSPGGPGEAAATER